jgi:hypothetical protein
MIEKEHNTKKNNTDVQKRLFQDHCGVASGAAKYREPIKRTKTCNVSKIFS